MGAGCCNRVMSERYAGFAPGVVMHSLARLEREEVGKERHVKAGQSMLAAPTPILYCFSLALERLHQCFLDASPS
jgi:hypothetical protein